jgi:hypothetical protein
MNMAAHPDRVWVEHDGARTRVQPETVEGADRMALWDRVIAWTQYADYQDETDREIPLVRLRPADR